MSELCHGRRTACRTFPSARPQFSSSRVTEHAIPSVSPTDAARAPLGLPSRATVQEKENRIRVELMVTEAPAPLPYHFDNSRSRDRLLHE